MEPLPFAVLARRVWLDSQDRLCLESILDSIEVDGLPTIAPAFDLAALFELSSAEIEYPESLLTRLIDPDGSELDMWRVPGQVISVPGSTRRIYRLIVQYHYVPVVQPGRHEIRIEYDVDGPEQTVAFEIMES